MTLTYGFTNEWWRLRLGILEMGTSLGVGTDDNELNFVHKDFEVDVGYLSESTL